MTKTLAMKALRTVIFVVMVALFCVAHVQEASHREAVMASDAAAVVEQAKANVLRVKAEAKAYADGRGCSTKATLSDEIVAIGTDTRGAGPYFYDTMYVLTFDEAHTLAARGQVWLVYFC